jgi:phosphoribosylformylglycinamidine (FGAM) synthase PurS component
LSENDLVCLLESKNSETTKKQLKKWMIKQLLNSVITKYRDLSVSQSLASANNW